MKSLHIHVFWGPRKQPTMSITFFEWNNGEHRHVMACGEPLDALKPQDGPWDALRLVWSYLAATARQRQQPVDPPD